MLIDATHAEETRVVVVDGNKVEEFDFEAQAKRQLAGNIYLAKVTRVEPSLQAAFVDYGGNRHGFLAFSEIHPDYYQIPVADREALLAEEREFAERERAEEEEGEKPKPKRRTRSRSRSAKTEDGDAVATAEASGMETIDLGEEEGDGFEAGAPGEALSPRETVEDTPVETPAAGEEDEAEDDAEAADAAQSEIESVTGDDTEEMRPVRKTRPRKYKIQEVIKVRQILLVQVVKEERGNKGAALTTYLSLAGRYCVLMPNTARGGGISRKITNAADRKKLKEIASSMNVPQGAGLIIRTAGSQRTKTEIKRDYEYLQRLWEQVRELTLKSIAPAPIYEEGNLIKRSIRDLYSKEIDEVIVEGEAGYRSAKDFMKMIMPSHAKNVKQYIDPMPLFARYQVESYLASMFNPTVQLPSGGYIVIGVTEALVAIDVNSGRATKEGSIEQTATKTNLEAADEVARQLRLRDLAGLIVIDFIDMDERKNNAAVEKRLKDKLKTDRARIQVGRISGFGLLEMSRQRLRPGMIEATTQPCPHCHGTGLLRSDDNVALGILRQIEEEGVRGRSREVLVKAPGGIVNYLINQKREHIFGIEARYGLSVRIEVDPLLISPDFTLEKFKTATRSVAEIVRTVVSSDSSILAEPEPDEDPVDEDQVEAEEAVAEAGEARTGDGDEGGDEKPKKRRRRRRRRKGGSGSDQNGEGQESSGEGEGEGGDEADETPDPVAAEPAPAAEPGDEEVKPKRTRTRSRSRRKPAAEETAAAAEADVAPAPVAEAAAETPADEPAAPVAEASADEPAAEPGAEVAAEEPAPAEEPAAEAPAEEPARDSAAEAPAEAEERTPESVGAEEHDGKPKRRGWWSLGR
ncbi:ribonuclease E/G [Histidinibacterium lentulum]|uniref:Ribonuclease E n=2 Tax=Histidinibacterium lentulum TaxID=2480588 RepID=A0A3N2RAH1_9RHOB|nr:ribonuclease E/G [Histidinibacterium lentulum]